MCYTASKTFAVRLNELMTVNGFSQNAVGCIISVPSQRIGEYLESRDMPSCENVCKLAKAFGVSTDYLLGVDILQPAARGRNDMEHFKVPVT